MDNIFLHFTSIQPFSLNINGNYVDLVDNSEKFCIDIIPNTNNLYVTYNPIGNDCTYLNYTQNIQIIANKPICNSDYVKIIPFCDNHFEIQFEPISANYVKKFEILYSKNYNNININIDNQNDSVIQIFDGEKLKFKTSCKILKQVESYIKENNLVIKGFIEKNSYYILILDINNFEIKLEKYCNKIEEIEDKINIMIIANDISKHAIVYSYNFTNNNKENFTIYLNNQPINTHIKALIPLQFLQCIKVGNLNYANTFLNEEIRNNNSNSLKDFFGEIDNIFFNSYSKDIINYTIESNREFKNYTFEIDNYKIIDIIES